MIDWNVLFLWYFNNLSFYDVRAREKKFIERNFLLASYELFFMDHTTELTFLSRVTNWVTQKEFIIIIFYVIHSLFFSSSVSGMYRPRV